jgi:hypothetical protein
MWEEDLRRHFGTEVTMKFAGLQDVTSCIAFYQVTQACITEDCNFFKEESLREIGHNCN